MNRAEKERLAARALRLEERIELGGESETEATERVDEWIDQWRETVADGRTVAFSNRLRRLGFSSDQLDAGFPVEHWPAGEPLPDWVDEAESIVDYIVEQPVDSADSKESLADEDEIPFIDVLILLVEYATERIDWSGPAGDLSSRAIDDCRQWLLDRLRTYCAHTLFIEFKTFVASRDESLVFADDPDLPADSQTHYNSFINELRQGKIASVFVEYAVLTRLLVDLIDQWTNVVEEFAARLLADRDTLTRTFARDGLGSITAIEFHGDIHDHGRLVFGITFESGTKLAYKPRDVSIEAAFSEFLDWVNDRSSLPNLRSLECVPRDEYGWIEWADGKPCHSHESVQRYYRRAGMLLCLLYALNFTDGHLENIVAAGDQPVFVDLETLLGPPELPFEKQIGEEGGREFAKDSILPTQLLPMFVPAADVRDQNGFGSAVATVESIERPVFENPNTDLMELSFEQPITIEGENLPVFEGERVDPREYSDDIAAGFEAMYRFLLDHKSELLGADSPLEVFTDATVRYLYRPTAEYGKLLSLLERPKYLRSGLEFDRQIEQLARPFACGDIDEEMWPIYEAERASLWRGDVPRFTVDTDGTTLAHVDRAVTDVFDATPVQAASERIRQLTTDDLDEQLAYIELAYEPRTFSHPDPPASGADGGDRLDGPEPFEEAARDVFRRLREHELPLSDGTPYWGLREHRVSGVYLPVLPDNLYTGRIGIGIFAAALAHVFDSPEYETFAANVVRPTIAELDDDEPFEAMKVGGTLGVGSVIYGFTKLGLLLDNEEYFDAARRTARTITADRLEDDNHLGPHRGSSGTIHGLLALYEALGENEFLDIAVTAGEYLLSHRVGREGISMWKLHVDDVGEENLAQWDVDPTETKWLGVPHGGDAIATALFRLADHTGETRFRDAAMDTIEYGRSSLDREPCPDVRIQTRQQRTNGWCDGQAGMGLARLALSQAARDDRLQTEATQVARDCDATRLSRYDHLYAGNFGRVEQLLSTGRAIEKPVFQRRAKRLAMAAIQRSRKRDRFTVPWQTDRWYNPSFYNGESGIGYSLLRLCDPDLPNVLLWE